MASDDGQSRAVGAAEICAADLGCADGIERLLGQIKSKPYRYEVLANNAGFGIHGDFASTDIDENIQLVNVQIAAALRLTRAVLPEMIERKNGRILNIASLGSFLAFHEVAAYCASKSAVMSLTKNLACEWAKGVNT